MRTNSFPLRGVLTALATPMKDSTVDFETFKTFVQWQIDSGVHGLVPCGTTGEAATLTDNEAFRLFELCVEEARDRVPVIANVGFNSLNATMKRAQLAQKAGVDALLVVTPYYNRPTPKGLVNYYQVLTENLDLPILLYNVPSRTAVCLDLPTIQSLAQFPKIIGIKDASDDLCRVTEIRRTLGHNFLQFSGNDDTAYAYITLGGHGVISVASNLFPEAFVRMYNCLSQGKYQEALKLHESLTPIIKGLFLETSPGPLKYLLKTCNRFASDELRLPLARIERSTSRQLDQILSQYTALESPIKSTT